MKWSQYDGKGIGVRQQKTSALLWIPCHARLKTALDAAPRDSEFIVGKSFTGDGLSNVVKRALRRIGAEQYTTHGLRKNAAIGLAEAGCTANVRSYCERIGRSAVDAKTRWNGVVTISANDRRLAAEPIVGKENWRVDGQEVSHV